MIIDETIRRATSKSYRQVLSINWVDDLSRQSCRHRLIMLTRPTSRCYESCKGMISQCETNRHRSCCRQLPFTWPLVRHLSSDINGSIVVKQAVSLFSTCCMSWWQSIELFACQLGSHAWYLCSSFSCIGPCWIRIQGRTCFFSTYTSSLEQMNTRTSLDIDRHTYSSTRAHFTMNKQHASYSAAINDIVRLHARRRFVRTAHETTPMYSNVIHRGCSSLLLVRYFKGSVRSCAI
jgi:hypothetical protein